MTLSALILAAIFVVGGVTHLAKPELYRPMMPLWLPSHDALIFISGIAEILGGGGLLAKRTRRAAAVGLIVLLVAVFPANIAMLRFYQARGVPWWAELLLWLRLPLQAVLVWWTWTVATSPPAGVRPRSSERPSSKTTS